MEKSEVLGTFNDLSNPANRRRKASSVFQPAKPGDDAPVIYNVAAFLTTDHGIDVRRDGLGTWPVTIEVGHASSRFTIFADVESARELRDALDAVLAPSAEEVAAALLES